MNPRDINPNNNYINEDGNLKGWKERYDKMRDNMLQVNNNNVILDITEETLDSIKPKIQVYFNRNSDTNNNIKNMIIENIRQYNCIHVAAAWITCADIILAFNDTNTEIIINNDVSLTTNNRLLNNLQNSSNIFRIYTNDEMLHHKFIVLGNLENNEFIPEAVITGSYNFTTAAKFNRENCLLIYDKNIAIKYEEEYQTLISELE